MDEEKVVISRECVKTLYDAKFVHLFDYQYAEGKHYFVASRNGQDDLVAVKSDEEFKEMYPDAVTCAVIVRLPGEEPKLLLQYEYRYATGRYLISPVAGLLDPADKEQASKMPCGTSADERIKNAVFTAAAREIHEESGLTVKPTDRMSLLTPLAFCTPGLTDESNAFVAAEIAVENKNALNHTGAEGTELFSDFVLIDRTQAREMMAAGRDPKGNFFSVATWFVLGYFGYIFEG